MRYWKNAVPHRPEWIPARIDVISGRIRINGRILHGVIHLLSVEWLPVKVPLLASVSGAATAAACGAAAGTEIPGKDPRLYSHRQKLTVVLTPLGATIFGFACLRHPLWYHPWRICHRRWIHAIRRRVRVKGSADDGTGPRWPGRWSCWCPDCYLPKIRPWRGCIWSGRFVNRTCGWRSVSLPRMTVPQGMISSGSPFQVVPVESKILLPDWSTIL